MTHLRGTVALLFVAVWAACVLGTFWLIDLITGG